jgi:hypothetical protein
MDAGCVCAILATGVAEIRLTQVQSQTPSQQKNLGVAAHTCLPSYHGKHKIGESWSKLTKAKRGDLNSNVARAKEAGAVEPLHSKCKALSANPITAKKKKHKYFNKLKILSYFSTLLRSQRHFTIIKYIITIPRLGLHLLFHFKYSLLIPIYHTSYHQNSLPKIHF